MVTSAKTVSSTGPRYTPLPKTVGVLSNILTLGTADLVINGTIDIGYLPSNAKVIDGIAAITDVDTGTAYVISIGDAASPARFVNASTAGQAAAVVRFGNDATAAATLAAHTAYTAPTKIYATNITAPGTAAAGTLSVSIFYETLEPPV